MSRADAGALITAELATAGPVLWTTHGRLTLLGHAVADLDLRELAWPLQDRLGPLSDCIANIGQVGVVGPVALALARLCLLTDDLDAAGYIAAAQRLSVRAQGRGAVLRCRLIAAQLALRLDMRNQEAELRAIAREARALGMRGIEQGAAALLDQTSIRRH